MQFEGNSSWLHLAENLAAQFKNQLATDSVSKDVRSGSSHHGRNLIVQNNA